MPPIQDHPLRYALTNELHARPAPLIPVPSTAAFLALKPAQDAAARDRGLDRAHPIPRLTRTTTPAPWGVTVSNGKTTPRPRPGLPLPRD